MSATQLTFTAPAWKWEGGNLLILTLPFDVADAIDDQVDVRGGFGSIRVDATVGSTTWRTSIFPSKRHESFILLLNKRVRAAEGFGEGDDVVVELRLL